MAYRSPSPSYTPVSPCYAPLSPSYTPVSPRLARGPSPSYTPVSPANDTVILPDDEDEPSTSGEGHSSSFTRISNFPKPDPLASFLDTTPSAHPTCGDTLILDDISPIKPARQPDTPFVHPGYAMSPTQMEDANMCVEMMYRTPPTLGMPFVDDWMCAGDVANPCLAQQVQCVCNIPTPCLLRRRRAQHTWARALAMPEHSCTACYKYLVAMHDIMTSGHDAHLRGCLACHLKHGPSSMGAMQCLDDTIFGCNCHAWDYQMYESPSDTTLFSQFKELCYHMEKMCPTCSSVRSSTCERLNALDAPDDAAATPACDLDLLCFESLADHSGFESSSGSG